MSENSATHRVEPDTLRELPLADMHRQAGARFGAFAGWSMPITYPPGVIQEHQHTRARAGLFDITHMALFSVEGPDAARLLSAACPLDAEGQEQGQSRYTFFLDDTAGILDDLIVTRLGTDRFLVVANAANAESDAAHLEMFARGLETRIGRLSLVFLALQGPESEAALKAAGLADLPERFMTALEPKPGWIVTRSGYTGEDGFEIAAPAAEARSLCETLLADDRVIWIGLAARDSLRLEAGLCLHGQDISPETDPVQARLMWAIPRTVRTAGRFRGAQTLARLLAEPPQLCRVGLKPEGRQPVRAGAPVMDEGGATVGRVTSGGFGPTVGHPVAMGYVPVKLASEGRRLSAEVRGRSVPLAVHALPFTPHRYRRG
jgi:aminomethyltransferase